LNRKYALFLVFFVSITLILSQNNAFAEAPEADAGPDQTVDEGDTVTLDGTGSTDAEGQEISFEWIYESDKKVHKDPFKGKNAANDEAAKPTFTTKEVKEDTTIIFTCN